MKILRSLISCAILFSLISPLFSVTEEELDRELLSDSGVEDKGTVKNKTSPLDIYGFIESTSHFSVPEKSEMNGGASKYETVKLEGRGRVNAKLGNNSYFGKAALDYYYYSGSESNSSAEDYRNPRESGKIEPRELFIKGGESFQFKIGKQLFSWGSADMFQVTNYFDRPDLREFFAIGKDDRNIGVTALSLKFLAGNFSIEAAVTPVHNPALFPGEDTFWELTPQPVELPGTILPVTFNGSEKLPSDLSNSSGAVRFGGSIGDLDFHLVYYNGINRIILMKPDLAVSSSNAFIEMKPYYDRIDAYGVDMAFTMGKLSVRSEASYSRKMIGVNKIDAALLQSGLIEITAANSTDVDISPVEKIPYVSYVIGADYNLWGTNGFILAEWMDGRYLKDRNKYIDPLITNVLLIRIEDTFFNENLKTEIGALLRPKQKKPGCLITFDITWDFQNGLTIGTGGFFFKGRGDEFFEYFEGKDIIYIKAKMEF